MKLVLRHLFAGTLTAAIPLIVTGSGAPPDSARPALELVGVLHDPRALNRAHDVELQGGLAFVVGKGVSLALVDISDPANLKLVSSMVDPVLLADAETVLPMGDVLLLGARDLLSIDISDPAQPKVLKRIADRPRIDRINGFARKGRWLFSANKTGYISAFDISEPSNPEYLGSFDAKGRGGQESPHDVTLAGTRLLVVDAGHGSEAPVRSYSPFSADGERLLSPKDWKVHGAVNTDTSTFDLRGANRIAGGEGYAFVGAFIPDRVGVIDVSHPERPRQIANMPVCDIDATGMTLAGKILFVSGGECVEAIDVSNPAEPVSLAQYRNGELFPSRRVRSGESWRFDNGHDLVYRDGFIYVTAQNDHRFGVLRVNDPEIRRLCDAGTF